MQHEITHAIPLLDERGNLTEPGWARRLLPVYDRARVKGGPTGPSPLQITFIWGWILSPCWISGRAGR